MPLSCNSLPDIIVVTTVSIKYIFLIITSSVHPSIQYLIAMFAIPMIGSSLDAVDIDISSPSGCSSVIAWSRLLQIWQAVPLSQTTLSLSGWRLVDVSLIYSEVATSLL